MGKNFGPGYPNLFYLRIPEYPLTLIHELFTLIICPTTHLLICDNLTGKEKNDFDPNII